MFTSRYRCPTSIEEYNKSLNRLLQTHSKKDIANLLKVDEEWIDIRLNFEPVRIQWRFDNHNYITDINRRFEIFKRPEESLNEEEYLYRKTESYLFTGGNPYKYFGIDNKTEELYGADTVKDIKDLMDARYGQLQLKEEENI